METRDQWYKPNLLYNIHYRPPKKPETPKMIVETVQFNPSVCTCGEHSCQPQYRMEKRVLWMKKEACTAKQQTKIKERGNEDEARENKFEESITKQVGKNGSITDSKQKGLKEETGQGRRHIEGNEGKHMELIEETGKKCHLKGDVSKQIELKEKTDQECHIIEGDGNKFGTAESFKEIISSEVEVRGAYKANGAVNEKENVEEEGNSDADEKEEKKEECDFKNELGCSNSKDDVCIDGEACNTSNIKENNSNDRSDKDNSEGRNSEGVYREKIIGNDPDSRFSNNCKRNVKRSNENQVNKDHTTGEGDEADDGDGAGDDAEYCSENTIVINDSDETEESCSPEREDDSLEDVEIASAFGIMTIYCNSTLHSWRSFEGEDA